MVQQQILVKDHMEVYNKSIMWKFFIQRKRKFSELGFNPAPNESKSGKEINLDTRKQG